MNVSLDIAAMVAAIAWPVVAVIILLRYRGTIQSMVGSGQIKQLSFAGFRLELGEAREMTMQGTAPDLLVNLSQPSSAAAIAGSGQEALFDQLKSDTPVDYAVLDLGDGDKWLTSRVYIIALLLQKMRGLRSLVFVATTQQTQRHFVGLADASKVRWTFAQHFPWLERTFSFAYQQVMSNPDVAITSSRGALGAYEYAPTGNRYLNPGRIWPAIQLLQSFLQEIQIFHALPPGAEHEWASLTTHGAFEHAQWLSPALLEEVLDRELVTSGVRSVDLYGRPNREQARILLSQPGQYVVLTQENGRFERLIDRNLLLEDMVQDILREAR